MTVRPCDLEERLRVEDRRREILVDAEPVVGGRRADGPAVDDGRRLDLSEEGDARKELGRREELRRPGGARTRGVVERLEARDGTIGGERDDRDGVRGVRRGEAKRNLAREGFGGRSDVLRRGGVEDGERRLGRARDGAQVRGLRGELVGDGEADPSGGEGIPDDGAFSEKSGTDPSERNDDRPDLGI